MSIRNVSMSHGAAVAGLIFAAAAHGAVPWLNEPAPQPPAAEQAPLAAQRPCAAADLKVSLGQKGAHRGHATQEIRLTNRGSDSCYLLGAPSIELAPMGGAREMVGMNTSMSAQQAAPQRIDLAPDGDAIVLIGTPGSCDAAIGPARRVVSRLQLTLLGGGTVVLEGAHVDTLCGPASVINVAALEDEPKHAARMALAATRATPWSALSASVSTPDNVARGGTLHYTVTLANAGSTPVPLSPCPSYTQSLHTEARTTTSTLRLNCAAAGGQIPANGSVSFDMQAYVPSDMSGEGVKLSWKLQDGAAAGTITPLR